MKVIELEQRGDEWHAWRKTGVGASESPAVLKMSPYKSPLQIWEQKTERSFPDEINADMQRGIDLEDEARLKFEMLTGNNFMPCCAEHSKMKNIKASFDGITMDHMQFVEIKCPRTKKLPDVIKKNSVDLLIAEYPHYWVQVQHQYAVCEEAVKGYLAAYLDEEIYHMDIPRDDEFINETLIPEILMFWKLVVDDKEPELTDMDYLFIGDDAEALSLAYDYKRLTEEIKAKKDRVEEIKQELISKGDDGNIIIGNVLKMTRYGKTSYNYKQACVDNLIDMEQYKKQSIGHYRITPIK